MGSSSGLSADWDFSHGKKFQKEILQLFGSTVHHSSPSPAGSFFLLATFRRFTFRLTEDSVSLALQSCLGGFAAGFHVKFLSDRHFRFSVASKAVGFHVYDLKRFIGSTFDVYFHLWNDGVAHWERDKRIWEEEQAKEWTLVTRKKRKSPVIKKHVSFAARLIQASPPVKHKPILAEPALKIGSFCFASKTSDVQPRCLIFGNTDQSNNSDGGAFVGVSTAFARLQRDLQMDHSLDLLETGGTEPCSSLAGPTQRQHADPKPSAHIPDKLPTFSVSKNATCWRCLGEGHTKFKCSNQIRCKACFNYGHMARWCFTRTRPQLMWAPKTDVEPKRRPKQSDQVSTEENIAISISGSSVSKPSSVFPSPSTPPPLIETLDSTTSEDDDLMANFPVNPMLFAPAGANIENLWMRPARGRLALGGEPPRMHEEYGIVTLEPQPAQHHLREALLDVIAFLEDEYNARIRSSSLSPLGLGLLQFASPTQRQSLIDLSPLPFGPHQHIRVAKHDRGLNLRTCNYTRECTIMFLAFPLDYQTMDYIKAAVAPFGRLLYWDSSDNNKSRVLVRVLVLSPDRIPRSLIVSQGTMLGGNGRSWAVPVYILDGVFPDVFPGDEDPVPANGDPHPLPHNWHQAHGHQQPGWMEDLHGNMNEDHHMVNVQNIQGQDDNHMDAGELQDWNEDQAAENNNLDPQLIEAQQNVIEQIPQHPIEEQDVISFRNSGSTAVYLRAHGPDIPIDMVFGQGASTSTATSSSSNEVSSQPHELNQLEAHTVTYGPALPPEMVIEKVKERVFCIAAHCSSRIISRSLADTCSTLKRSWENAFKPVIVDSSILTLDTSLGETVNKNIVRKLIFEEPSINELAIVPYQPVVHQVMLQLLAASTDQMSNLVTGQEHANADDTTTLSQMIDLATAQPDVHESSTESSQTNVQDNSETFDSLSIAADKEIETLERTAYPPPRPTKTPRKGLLLNASAVNPATQLANVRRSPRLDKQNEGYKHVRLEDTPRKRRKRTVKVQDQASLISTLDGMVKEVTHNPQKTVPLQLMQDLGESYCQMAPEEISEEKLKQPRVSNGE
ncbi:hypothetical protein EJB05_55207, partial [Eragrostis curvula]